jgi:tetratricopeptide (TPR) repeat protein
MNPNLSDWDDDLPPEPEEAYQDLLRALKRKSGFGLFFVQCTPVEVDNFIVKLPQEIPQKKIAVLRFVEPIDNLYQPVAEFVKDKQVDILLIKGLEYSLYKYEKRSFGEITEGQFSNLTSVPHILNHLNQQRERFRDDFPISFVFLLRSFSINYFIHRAPDFFDWRSGVFELPTTPEVVDEEYTRLLNEAEDEEYLNLSTEQKIEKVLEIQELLTEKHIIDSRKARLLSELGRFLATAQEYEAVLTAYDQALTIQPNSHHTWNSKGITLHNLGRGEEAINSFNEALKIKPNYHYAWNWHGYVLNDLGRYEESIISYEQTLKIKPDDDYAWFARGQTLKNLGRNEEAIASYDQALKFKPDDHDAWNNRGIALGNLGRNEEAIASYDQALKFKPDDHEAWNNRGIALRQLGRFEEAIASYNQALKFKPDDHEAWNNWGIALRQLGRNEEAIASYDQALKFKPDLHETWYNKACSYALQVNIEQALENLQKAINLNPDEYRKMAKTDSDFDAIRENERFQALIE